MLFSSSGGPAWIVAFLGNPGPRYAFTRHNAGFMACDALADEKGFSVSRLRFSALTALTEIGKQKVLVMKPQTFMNLSGDSVGKAAQFYKVPSERVLVVSDDVSLPVGKLRIRTKGSAGGHNGLKSVISVLGTEDFPRIRIGVGAPPHPDFDMADWVLDVFRDQDALDIREAVKRAAQAVECFIHDGPERAMNRFN